MPPSNRFNWLRVGREWKYDNNGKRLCMVGHWSIDQFTNGGYMQHMVEICTRETPRHWGASAVSHLIALCQPLMLFYCSGGMPHPTNRDKVLHFFMNVLNPSCPADKINWDACMEKVIEQLRLWVGSRGGFIGQLVTMYIELAQAGLIRGIDAATARDGKKARKRKRDQDAEDEDNWWDEIEEPALPSGTAAWPTVAPAAAVAPVTVKLEEPIKSEIKSEQ